MEGELIYVSIVSGLFGIFGLLLLNRNWFKKQTFKSEIELLRAKNKLELRKLEKELGLQAKKDSGLIPTKEAEPNMLSTIGALAPLLRNLDGEQIADLVERFTIGPGESEAAEGTGGGLGDIINDFVLNNPDAVKAFLGGLKSGQKGQESGGNSQV